jgi:hypothetical protein
MELYGLVLTVMLQLSVTYAGMERARGISTGFHGDGMASKQGADRSSML